MHLVSLLDMVESGFADRALLEGPDGPVTGADLGRLARAGASTLSSTGGLVYVGENHPLLPVAVFAAARAGVPFIPVNYRLDDAQLIELVDRYPDADVFTDEASASRVGGHREVRVLDDWLAALPSSAPTDEDPPDDDTAIAVVLFTSGTTSAPKSALLRHRHLMAYLLNTVTFGGASPDEAALVAVPPYHVAGMANMFSNLFAGRRLVYLRRFDPDEWLSTVRDERVTNAMVVPTMLVRIVDALAGRTADVPTLRSLSYGGARIAERAVREAVRLFPGVDFVNAYGLTETASTIAVLGPDDHRRAIESDDPDAIRRLGSAGRVLPSVEVEIRDDDGTPVPPGVPGFIYVRGEQVAGEYATGSVLDADGWFSTRDRGWLDEGDYLFIEGRADDTIIRGGENIAPAEIEEALCTHPAVKEACVVGVPDDEWGQRIEAAVVLDPGASVAPDELVEHVRGRLRRSKTPDWVVIREELPYTPTGKLLRRQVLQELSEGRDGSTSTR